jgi:hypothetical protein
MKRLRINKKVKWLTKIWNWLCEYMTSNAISVSFSELVKDEVNRRGKFDNNQSGLIA